MIEELIITSLAMYAALIAHTVTKDSISKLYDKIIDWKERRKFRRKH